MIDPFHRPTPAALPILEGRVYVLCEGIDEAALVREIAKRDSLTVVAGIRHPDLAFEEELRLFEKMLPRFRPAALGVLVDKERNGNAAEHSLRKWIEGAHFRLPDYPGQVIGDAHPELGLRLGYFLNPAARNSGAIEQLFVDQLASRFRDCVDSFVGCAEGEGAWDGHPNLEVLRDKVRMRAYLAITNRGRNTGLNAALENKHLTVDTPSCDSLRDFLHALAS